jgi:hypothetical protein
MVSLELWLREVFKLRTRRFVSRGAPAPITHFPSHREAVCAVACRCECFGDRKVRWGGFRKRHIFCLKSAQIAGYEFHVQALMLYYNTSVILP